MSIFLGSEQKFKSPFSVSVDRPNFEILNEKVSGMF